MANPQSSARGPWVFFLIQLLRSLRNKAIDFVSWDDQYCSSILSNLT